MSLHLWSIIDSLALHVQWNLFVNDLSMIMNTQRTLLVMCRCWGSMRRCSSRVTQTDVNRSSWGAQFCNHWLLCTAKRRHVQVIFEVQIQGETNLMLLTRFQKLSWLELCKVQLFKTRNKSSIRWIIGPKRSMKPTRELTSIQLIFPFSRQYTWLLF